MKKQRNKKNQGITLSPREKEVLTLLANGKTREEISQILPIKAVTIRAHLENAREKLGATNILHAATIALAQGLIEMISDNLLINENDKSENIKDQENLVLGRSRRLHSHRKMVR